MTELAPCPFCGGVGRIDQFSENMDEWRVCCETEACGAWGPETKTQADAYSAWNRRAMLAARPAAPVPAEGGDIGNPITEASAPTQPEAGDDDVVLYGGPIIHDGGICHYIDLTGESQPEAGGEIEAVARALMRTSGVTFETTIHENGAETPSWFEFESEAKAAIRALDAHRSAQGTADE